MATTRDYTAEDCSLARSLEIVGERWTLLIVRDAFYGVQRFADFAAHLRIPRAILSERLSLLVRSGVLTKSPGPGRRELYRLTDKGIELFPVLRTLVAWGDKHYAPRGPRRHFRHADDNGEVNLAGVCQDCGKSLAVRDYLVTTGPGAAPLDTDADVVTRALAHPHRLLDPITG
ncbi:winged helix-turn-helix transcriptional regulator [Kutzneria sp. CA-103260]|uniref:winged helix-turn-helix transcriptional regulator n=1 Tax=Kutzneria sp. CA-103260 TaxID=2802641 RepID=UPI001BA699BA|nr:helix-turn-helix domain-containing protein [Kutzneria sp. CA-103260]QUQ62301.1 transcriptional regulator [Kutzneria sp. CA-103260]